jgi:aspartate aminotransferase
MSKSKVNPRKTISKHKIKKQNEGHIVPARRMKQIKRSATLKLADRAKELALSGKKIISFSLGEPDFKTPAHIIKGAKAALDKGYTHYTPALGIPELRSAVVEHYSKNKQMVCEAGNVMITPTKMGIYNSILAFISPGDEVIIPEPAWVTYEPCVKLAQGKVNSLELKAEEAFRVIPEKLAELITPKTKMIILNTPCNPTGGIYQKSDLKGIAELAVDHNILILTDETYEKIIYEGKHYSIADQPNMFDRTITVSGFSKSYAMTGWRVGWLIAEQNLFNEVKKLQEHSLTCATSFAQYGALTALKSSQKCVADMVKEFKARREIVVKGLNDIEGFSCNTPKGAFYAFPSYDYKMNSSDIATYLLDSAGVALTPGSGFGKPGEYHLRMSYAASRSQIKEGLGKIKNAVENNKKLKKRSYLCTSGYYFNSFRASGYRLLANSE